MHCKITTIFTVSVFFFFLAIICFFQRNAFKEHHTTKLTRTSLPSEIVFVHISKTGGSTIQKFLSNNNIRYHLVHCRPLPKNIIRGGRKIIVSVREPLSRVISAFNWRSPYGGGIHKFGKNNTAQEMMFHSCFHNVSIFVKSFSAHKSNCRDIAHNSLKNREHIGMGYVFYLKQAMSKIRDAHIYVIRQEHLQADLLGLQDWIKYPIKNYDVSHARASYDLHSNITTGNISDYHMSLLPLVTNDEIVAFKRLLHQEYKIYHNLLFLSRRAQTHKA